MTGLVYPSGGRVHPVMWVALALVGVFAFAACGGNDTSDHDVGSSLPGSALATGLACDTAEVTVFFWPEGHSEVPSINAPEAPTPHVEVAVAQFGSDFEVGYFDTLGEQVPGDASCTELKAAIQPSALTQPVQERTSLVLTCQVSVRAEIWVTDPGGTPAEVEVVDDERLIVVVELKPTRSLLSFEAETCGTEPAPSS